MTDRVGPAPKEPTPQHQVVTPAKGMRQEHTLGPAKNSQSTKTHVETRVGPTSSARARAGGPTQSNIENLFIHNGHIYNSYNSISYKIDKKSSHDTFKYIKNTDGDITTLPAPYLKLAENNDSSIDYSSKQNQV